MVKIRSFLSLLSFILLIASFSRCKEDAPVVIRTSEALDTTLQNIYDRSTFGGFSVSVVKEGEVAFQRSYGKANVAGDVDLTNQTAMNIASISKLFIGVALMKAIEQGHFTLETTINDILPFPVANPHAPETPIQVKHLVTHTSGILDDEDTYFRNYSILAGEDLNTPSAQRLVDELHLTTDGQVLSLADFMQAYLTPNGTLYQATNFNTTPAGSTYAYSNIASALAAYLIELSTGENFEEYTQKAIFDPLNMRHTAWRVARLDRSNVSLQYWNRDNPLPFYTIATYPEGTLTTSVEDLTVFMQEMMKAQAGESDFLLTKASYQVLFDKKLTPRPPGMPEKEDNYGVFWVWSTSGRIGHTGGDIGSTTFLGFDPNTRTGSILLINSNVVEVDEEDGISAAHLAEIVRAYKSFEQVEQEQ
jgi:CubicO group peptidase (beta-lactamase class C family)